MEKMPELYFNKGIGLTDFEKEKLTEYSRNSRLDLPVERSELSEERKRLVAGAISDQISWFRENLNLDIEARIPSMEQIRFFQDDEWGHILERFNIDSECGAFTLTGNNEILILDDEEPVAYNRLSHELVHRFGRTTFCAIRDDVSKNDNPLPFSELRARLDGYSNLLNDSFDWLNETVTETLNIEVLSKSDKDVARAALHCVPRKYMFSVIALDIILEKITDISGKQQGQDVRKSLYKGYFNGDTAALKDIANHFGKKALQALSNMGEEYHDYSRISFVLNDVFGINPSIYMEKVNAFERGETITISNGISIAMEP